MPEQHLMIDIETYDTQVTASILSIGAVAFDPRGNGDLKSLPTFSTTISPDSNQYYGRTVSEQTVLWWEQQSEPAKQLTFGGEQMDLYGALKLFTEWINCLSPKATRVWAKDPDFDINILSHACSQLRIYWPFKFWETRSVRTAMELAYPEGDFPHMILSGPKHDAMADAKRQVLEIQHSFFILGA